jgi:thiol-disulfide isomerase/thioredoxin
MNKRLGFFASAAVLGALFIVGGCGEPPAGPLTSARVVGHMTAFTEASGSEHGRHFEVDLDLRNPDAPALVWRVQYDDDSVLRENTHIAAGIRTYIGQDSTLTVDSLDGAAELRNYFDNFTLPHPLLDSAWFTRLEADTAVTFEWADGPGSRQQTLTIVRIPDETDEDFHAEDSNVKTWIFEGVDQRPVSHTYAWYMGNMAYGTTMEVDFEWSQLNEPGLADAVANWAPPSWTALPQPESEVAGGGGDEDWYETTLAALPQIGSQAPALSGTWLAGGPADLDSLDAELVFLDFWYIGCGPCMAALPHLQALEERHADRGFRVVGVNHHQDAATIARYLGRRDVQLSQMLLDSLPDGYPVRAYPTWMLIDGSGTVRDVGMGFGDDSDAYLDSAILSLTGL